MSFKLVNAGNATTIAKDDRYMDGSATDLCGIFMGCRFIDPNTNQLTFSQQFPGKHSTDDMAYVVDDPNVLFKFKRMALLMQEILQVKTQH